MKQRIEGTIVRADGERVSFAIHEGGAQQWGVPPSELGQTADVVTGMAAGAHESGFFDAPEAPAGLTPDEAQELRECIEQAADREGDWLVALERAQELAAKIAPTDPERDQ